MPPLNVEPIPKSLAAELVVKHHYLHRRPPMSYAFGAFDGGELVGVITFGTPPSRHLQLGVCPSRPELVIELNRLWMHDRMPRNSESFAVARALALLPPRIVVSYADTAAGHVGYIYRALSFKYAGWTDMERKTPRFDYVPLQPGAHSREAFRSGYGARVRRRPKVRYWITTGSPAERRQLAKLCAWPSMDWRTSPPPEPEP